MLYYRCFINLFSQMSQRPETPYSHEALSSQTSTVSDLLLADNYLDLVDLDLMDRTLRRRSRSSSSDDSIREITPPSGQLHFFGISEIIFDYFLIQGRLLLRKTIGDLRSEKRKSRQCRTSSTLSHCRPTPTLLSLGRVRATMKISINATRRGRSAGGDIRFEIIKL